MNKALFIVNLYWFFKISLGQGCLKTWNTEKTFNLTIKAKITWINLELKKLWKKKQEKLWIFNINHLKPGQTWNLKQ